MNATNEVLSDLLVVKEKEAFYRSKGNEPPDATSSIAEAVEKLQKAEKAELYRKI
jgi:hypothetical protein